MLKTTCGNCPAGCGLKVFLQDHEIVDIFGDEDHPTNKGSICPKGMLSHYHLSNPDRLTAPQIREKASEPFSTVSWPEALEFIAAKLEKTVERHGRQAVRVAGWEADPFSYTAGATWFAAHYGAGNIPSQFYPSSFGDTGVVQRMFGVPGHRMLMNTPRDWAASQCILVFRSDLAATDPMTVGPLLDARDRGATLLAIDSKKTITTSRAQFSLLVKPGTEAIALKGLVHLLLRDGLISQKFLAEWTDGIAPLAPLVSACGPETVARQCGVRQEDLLEMAALLGKSNRPLQVIAGDWFSRRFLADEELCLCGALVTLTGSVGIPGGGLNLLCGSPFSWPEMIAGQPTAGRRPPNYKASQCLSKLLSDPETQVGALFCHGNIYPRLGGGGAVQDALDKIPLIVQLGSYPDETHHRAHVSLPMSYWLEYEGLLPTSNGRALQWHHKVVEAPGQCRSPLEFWTDLAHLCGLGEHFPWRGSDGSTDHRRAADYFLGNCPLTAKASIDLLDPETNPSGGLLWPCTNDEDLAFEDNYFIKGNVRGPNILFQRQKNFPLSERRFPTPSGRITFEGLDVRPPNGAVLPPAEHYPLTLIVGTLVDCIAEFGFFVGNRKPGEGSPFIKIHPQVARLLGISGGTPVVVENELGSVVGPAWLSDEVAPGTVWCPEAVDPRQPHFSAQSPRSLFSLLPGASCETSRTKVTLYKQGENRDQSRKLVEAFLAQREGGQPLAGEKDA